MPEKGVEFVKVDSLKPHLKNVNLTVKIIDVGEPRQVTSRKDRSVHTVAETLVGDETGCVVLSLWDDQINAFDKGDVIQIENGFTSLFRGSLRLNIGKRGNAQKVERKLEKVNTENNLSKIVYESSWNRTRIPFRRRRRY